MGASKKGDDGSSFVFFVLLFLLFLIVAWPYLLGTWLAVELGAENPSTARSVAGWFLEVLWLGGLAALAANGWLKAKRKEQQERRLALEKQQRRADFGARARSCTSRPRPWRRGSRNQRRRAPAGLGILPTSTSAQT